MALADVQTQRQLDDAALFPWKRLSRCWLTKPTRCCRGRVSSLSQVLLRLGRADAALTAAETAVSRLRAAGTNLLAHGLTHRAAVYIYLGQFEAALGDLRDRQWASSTAWTTWPGSSSCTCCGAWMSRSAGRLAAGAAAARCASVSC